MLNRIIKKYVSMDANVRAGIWYTVCSFLQKGISFLTVPIFTRLLSKEQYGSVSVYYSWEAILTVFCTLNLFSGVFNNGMIKFERERDRFLASMQGVVTILTVCVFIFYLAFHGALNGVFKLDISLMCFMFLEILTSAAYSFWAAKQRFELRYKKMVALTLTVSACSPLCAIAAISLLPREYGVNARIFAGGSVLVLIYGIIYILNFKKGHAFFEKNYWKYGFLFNIPLLPHYLSSLILNQSDRLMISNMVGLSQAGIYSLSHNLAFILNILTNSINSAFAPWLYVRLKNKDYDEIPGAGNILFLLAFIALILLMLFAPEVVLLMGGHEYMEAIYIIPPLTASLYFVFMYQVFANVEFFFEENHFIMYASVSGAILNIILNYIFIRFFGYIAAGYTTLVCYIIFGCAHCFFMKKTIRKNLPEVKMFFDLKYIFLLSILLILLAGLILATYGNPMLRYILIVLIIVSCIVKRNELIRFITKFLRRKSL